MPDETQFPERAKQHRGSRWLVGRIEKKGLRPRYAAYIVIAFWSLAIVVFGVVERLIDPDTFGSIWLGIWWATQTVTTVGYGDVVPEQTAGKVIAAFLMIGGLSFLAVLTGAITSAFVTRAQAEQRDESAEQVMARFNEVSSQLEAIRADLDERSRSG
jgi:voltage-gated potassium channel